MRYLRLFLIVASIAGVIWLALAAKAFIGEYQGEYVAMFFLTIAALLALNAYYLYRTAQPGTSRLERFVTLWRQSKDAP